MCNEDALRKFKAGEYIDPMNVCNQERGAVRILLAEAQKQYREDHPLMSNPATRGYYEPRLPYFQNM